MCCRENYTKLEGGSIAVGVIQIFVCIYFFPLGFYNLGVIVNSGNEWLAVYHIFAMTVLIFEAVCGWAFSTTLLIGIKKRNPNCLLSYIVWVCLSHFFLNTIFLIATILLMMSPYVQAAHLYGNIHPDFLNGLHTLYAYTCEGCESPTITVADTWAGICYTDPETKQLLCSDKFCYPDEIIDRSTCKPDGLLKDCKCIQNPDITFIKPTTVSPTPDPFVGCESCLNSKLSISDSFAGQCIPHRPGSECRCICGDVFCKPGQQIDRTTCVVGGSLSTCKCIDVVVTSTASTPIEE